MYLGRAHHQKLSLFQLIVRKIWSLNAMNNILLKYIFLHTCGCSWSSPTLQQLPAGLKTVSIVRFGRSQDNFMRHKMIYYWYYRKCKIMAKRTSSRRQLTFLGGDKDSICQLCQCYSSQLSSPCAWRSDQACSYVLSLQVPSACLIVVRVETM